MLTNPFTGKELYIQYEITMDRMYHELTEDEKTEEWDKIGKSKKQAWNNLAKMINERMRSEPNFIKGEVS